MPDQTVKYMYSAQLFIYKGYLYNIEQAGFHHGNAGTGPMSEELAFMASRIGMLPSSGRITCSLVLRFSQRIMCVDAPSLWASGIRNASMQESLMRIGGLVRCEHIR